MESSAFLDALLGHVHGLEAALFGADGRCRLARGRRLDRRGDAPGLPAAELFPAPWQAPVLAAIERAAGGEPVRAEVTDPEGATLVVTTTAWRAEPGAVLLTLLDVTAERDARRRIAAATARFRTIFDHTPVPMRLVGPDLRTLRANGAVAELTGHPREVHESDRVLDLWDPAEVTQVVDAVTAVLRDERASAAFEHTLIRADGRRLRVRTHARPVELDDGRIGALVETIDISSQQGLADELRRLTTQDPLTGLLNRDGLQARLASAANRDGSTGGPTTLLLADVDDFARVNEVLGTAEGDLVLREVADALRAAVRESDPIARIGGDEFAILLPGLDVDAAGTVAEAVMERFAGRIADRGGDAALLDLTLSIGITGVAAGTTLDRALTGAGIAVYAAKQAGKGRWMAGL